MSSQAEYWGAIGALNAAGIRYAIGGSVAS